MAHQPSLTQAISDWLAQHNGLAETTRAAYRGEVHRFGEYLATKQVTSMTDVGEHHWVGYLKSLTEDGTERAGEQRRALKISSALQAGRITRLFLRYCWTVGYISWLPSLGNQRSPVGPSAAPRLSIPASLVDIVLGRSASTTEDGARLGVAIALSFWASLKPRELAALRRSDLVEQKMDMKLNVPGRAKSPRVPSLVNDLIRVYEGLRCTNCTALAPRDPPLLTRLRSYEPLTAFTIWNLLKSAPNEMGQAPVRLGSRMIRASLVALAATDLHQGIDEIQTQTGSPNFRHRVDQPAARYDLVGFVKTKLEQATLPNST